MVTKMHFITRITHAGLAIVLLLAISNLSVASEQKVVAASSIISEQKSIRADIEARSEKYSGLSGNQRQEILNNQDELFQLLDGKQSVADLSKGEQKKVIDSLDRISELTSAGDGERLVCERVKVVGSNRVERICKTASERDRERLDAQKNMDQRRNVCGSGGKCSGV